MTPSNASSEQIKRNIDQTRGEMDRTLDELGDRLHPRNLLDEVLDIFRSDGGGSSQVSSAAVKVTRILGRQLRQEPGPTLMIAGGLAWWVYNSISGDDDDVDRMYRRSLRGRRGYYRPAPRYAGERYSDGGDYRAGARSELGPHYYGEEYGGADQADLDESSSAVDKLKEGASEVKEKVVGATESVAESASQAASSARQSLSEARRRAGRYSYAARDRMERTSEQNPLLLGAGFLAMGLLAGIALPKTQQENRWMGEASDQLTEQVKEKGEELLEKGKAVAATAVGSALSEAEAHGVTPENIAGKVKRVAEKVGEAASQAVKEEGLGKEKLKEAAGEVAQKAKDSAKTEAQQQARQAGGPTNKTNM